MLKTYATHNLLLPFITVDAEIAATVPCVIHEDAPVDHRHPFVRYRLVALDPSALRATIQDLEFYDEPAPLTD